jgi:hypothetical protein
MVGSTSEEIVEHIRAAWAIGQECVDLVREELGPILADVHVPIVAGGVQLHKLQGVMHDTCNTANKTDVHVPIVVGGVQLHKLQGVMHDTCNTANKTAS